MAVALTCGLNLNEKLSYSFGKRWRWRCLDRKLRPASLEIPMRDTRHFLDQKSLILELILKPKIFIAQSLVLQTKLFSVMPFLSASITT